MGGLTTMDLSVGVMCCNSPNLSLTTHVFIPFLYLNISLCDFVGVVYFISDLNSATLL